MDMISDSLAQISVFRQQLVMPLTRGEAILELAAMLPGLVFFVRAILHRTRPRHGAAPSIWARVLNVIAALIAGLLVWSLVAALVTMHAMIRPHPTMSAAQVQIDRLCAGLPSLQVDMDQQRTLTQGELDLVRQSCGQHMAQVMATPLSER